METGNTKEDKYQKLLCRVLDKTTLFFCDEANVCERYSITIYVRYHVPNQILIKVLKDFLAEQLCVRYKDLSTHANLANITQTAYLLQLKQVNKKCNKNSNKLNDLRVTDLHFKYMYVSIMNFVFGT